MCFAGLPATIPKQRFFGRQRQNVSYRNIVLVPFENEHAAGCQYSEALRKALSEHLLPPRPQTAVFDVLVFIKQTGLMMTSVTTRPVCFLSEHFRLAPENQRFWR